MPNISDRPAANSAYSPPSSAPCKIASIQVSIPGYIPKYARRMSSASKASGRPSSVTRPSMKQ